MAFEKHVGYGQNLRLELISVHQTTKGDPIDGLDEFLWVQNFKHSVKKRMWKLFSNYLCWIELTDMRQEQWGAKCLQEIANFSQVFHSSISHRVAKNLMIRWSDLLAASSGLQLAQMGNTTLPIGVPYQNFNRNSLYTFVRWGFIKIIFFKVDHIFKIPIS